MSAVLKDRDLDPPEFKPLGWNDLTYEQKINCLNDAMSHHPRAIKLINQFYSEALTLGVNPLDYV